MEESGSPVLLMLRLKISDKKLTEVETEVTRSRAEAAIFAIEGLKEASKAMAFVPERRPN